MALLQQTSFDITAEDLSFNNGDRKINYVNQMKKMEETFKEMLDLFNELDEERFLENQSLLQERKELKNRISQLEAQLSDSLDSSSESTYSTDSEHIAKHYQGSSTVDSPVDMEEFEKLQQNLEEVTQSKNYLSSKVIEMTLLANNLRESLDQLQKKCDDQEATIQKLISERDKLAIAYQDLKDELRELEQRQLEQDNIVPVNNERVKSLFEELVDANVSLNVSGTQSESEEEESSGEGYSAAETESNSGGDFESSSEATVGAHTQTDEEESSGENYSAEESHSDGDLEYSLIFEEDEAQNDVAQETEVLEGNETSEASAEKKEEGNAALEEVIQPPVGPLTETEEDDSSGENYSAEQSHSDGDFEHSLVFEEVEAQNDVAQVTQVLERHETSVTSAEKKEEGNAALKEDIQLPVIMAAPKMAIAQDDIVSPSISIMFVLLVLLFMILVLYIGFCCYTGIPLFYFLTLPFSSILTGGADRGFVPT